MYEGLSEAQRSEGPCSREAAAYIFCKILKWTIARRSWNRFGEFLRILRIGKIKLRIGAGSQPSFGKILH